MRVFRDIVGKGNLPETHIARGSVIDLKDNKVSILLEKSEIEELNNRTPPTPESDSLFRDSMERFSGARTASDFRSVVENVPYRAKGERYNFDKHSEAVWVNSVILGMYVPIPPTTATL